MLFHLKDKEYNGGCLPHGALFRGATEGKIRQYIIQHLNCLDDVIGLQTFFTGNNSNLHFGFQELQERHKRFIH
jgi:type I restriction-modification system DNA methylase subunit